MPYVAKIMAQLNSRETELARIKSRNSANARGIIAGEFMRWLQVEGPASIPRMARNLNINESIVGAVARALSRARKITLTRNGRGVDVAELRGE